MEPPSSWIARLPAFAAPLFGAGLLIIPARGGVQLTSLNYSSVYFSTSDFANQATLNVLWNFLNSLYRGGAIQTNPYEVMPVAEATAIRDSLLERGGPAPAESLLRIRRPNVIIIIWEGFTAKAVTALGGRPGITPHFDTLIPQGVFFDRFYASGNRTDKGVAAILAGYPALLNTAVLKEPRKYAGLPGLGRSFADAGYVTEFLKGGELEFANIRAFVLKNGFTRLVERKDFPRETVGALRSLLGLSNLTDAIGSVYARGDAIVVPLPHPSGASGWLNDAANRERLDRALAIVRSELQALEASSERPRRP